jgi:hypothetical protein
MQGGEEREPHRSPGSREANPKLGRRGSPGAIAPSQPSGLRNSGTMIGNVLYRPPTPSLTTSRTLPPTRTLSVESSHTSQATSTSRTFPPTAPSPSSLARRPTIPHLYLSRHGQERSHATLQAPPCPAWSQGQQPPLETCGREHSGRRLRDGQVRQRPRLPSCVTEANWAKFSVTPVQHLRQEMIHMQLDPTSLVPHRWSPCSR